jgi:apolipoprotein N-acyltransferase
VVRPGLGWLALAAVSGVVWGLCFGREPWSVAAWAALAPLVLLMGAAGGRRWTALLGFVHGLAAWVAAIRWIVPTLETFGELPRWLSVVCLLIVASYLGAYHAAFAVLGRAVWRRGHAAAVLLALPSLWTALEWLRAWLFAGFPWNLAAYAWLEMPGALPTAAWIGAYGVGGLLVFANAGVALAVARRRAGRARWALPLAAGLLVPLLVLAAGARWGAGGSVDRHSPLAAAAGAPVRLLQPNIENQVQPDWATIRANYDRVLEMSRDACEPGALVVWPESAAWPYSFAADAAFRRDVLHLAESGGCTLFFNSVHPTPAGYYNSAFVVAPDGEPVRYDKRRLVPFGEYVPFAGVFSFVDTLARNAGSFVAAEGLTLLPWRPVPAIAGGGTELLGTAICYEIVYPELVAASVQEGATILVTITNDAWYGDTAAPWQHYAAARFRAAENRRPVLRAAITGVSALIAPDGGERARLDPFERGVIRGPVAGRRELSPYSRAPWLVPLVSALLGLALLVAAWWRGR